MAIRCIRRQQVAFKIEVAVMAKKTGRPSKFTKELAIKICDRIAGGESLCAVCRDIGIPEPTVIGWFVDDKDGVFDYYARARKIQGEQMFEDLLNITDDSQNDWMERNGHTVVDQEAVQRSKLRVDTRKWILARMDTQRYAETSKQEHTGKGGEPLQINIIRDTLPESGGDGSD